MESSRAQRREADRHARKAQRRSLRAEYTPRPLPNVPLLVPALLGLGLAGYLAAAAWLEAAPLACAAGSACDLVQTSRFATLLGVPTAAWGAALYAALAATAVAVRQPARHGRLALGISGVGLAVSLYLTGVSLLEIGATCAWCLASLALIALCFGVALAQWRAGAAALRGGRPLALTAVVSALLVGGLHLHYRGVFDPAAGPEDPQLRALAEHLADTDARFYGAAWCPHCNDQKEVFGASAHRLPYVECSPEGPYGPQAPACREAGIESYPTWVIDGTHRTGLIEPHRLARLSGFAWPSAEPVR